MIVALDCAGIEEADRQLDGQRGGARVRELCVEVRVQVPEADPAQRLSTGSDTTARGTGAEERQVGEDVVALVEAELAADEQLAPLLASHRHVDLAHVDLCAEVVVCSIAVDL